MVVRPLPGPGHREPVTDGSRLGGVMFPIMINRLLPGFGFLWSRGMSVFLILALLVANLVTRACLCPLLKKVGGILYYGVHSTITACEVC